MSTWSISLVVGIALGMVYGIWQHFRIKHGLNQLVLRNLDGSVYGGHFKVIFGVVILWTVVGFIVTFVITSIVKWII